MKKPSVRWLAVCCSGAILAAGAAISAPGHAEAQRGEDLLYQRSTYETGLRFTLPLWLTEGGIEPGFGFEGRFAWEVDAFSPGFFLGWQTNQVDVVAVRPSTGDQEPLDTLWVGFGGRFYGYNPTAVVPFIGAAFQLNFWSATIDAGYVDGEYVEERYFNDGERRVTPAMRGQLGVAIELSRHFGLEVGADATITFEGSVFNDEELYLSPFLGGTAYY